MKTKPTYQELEAKLHELEERHAALGFKYIGTEDCLNHTNVKLQELVEAAESFLRAPSIGSDGPGSCTIVVQEYNIRRVKAAINAAKEK